MPPAIPDKIPCESIETFKQELAALGEELSFQETEETWDRIARSLARFGAIIKGGGYKFERELINGVKAFAKPIASAMNSERTRLSAAALECIGVIAPRIGLAFEALVPLFVPHILRLATRSNKVYVTRSQTTLGLILGFCHIPSIIPYLLVSCKESKISTGRAVALEGVLRCLKKWDWTERDIRTKVGDIEETIRITGRDKDAGIRQTSRKVFEAYKILFPERVDEFTGPLTPVMRKYLDIKSVPNGQKPIEPMRPQSATERSREPPTKHKFSASMSATQPSANDKARSALTAHARSGSSNAVIEASSSGNSKSNHRDGITDPRSMPPPATIPTHVRNASRSQAQSHADHQQEGKVRYERQRVISTASSTHSTKSAPPDSHSTHAHRPPVRLVPSQKQPSRGNPVEAGPSGRARRVQNVVPVEPHPANRPDPSTMAHKAPVRPTHLANANGPKTSKTNSGPARQPIGDTQSAPSSTTRITFPTSEASCAAPMERKGAQRVPKHVPSPPGSAPGTPPKSERPATVTGVTSKREVKPSIFHRGVSGKPESAAKEAEKKQEGFVPRRGGGFTQPTLSQLSKQKPSASGNSAASHAPRSRALVASSRPVWGAGGALKPGHTRGLPVSKARGRGGISRAETPEHSDNVNAKQPMMPLPANPGREEGEVVPRLVPLPASPKAEIVDSEQTPEAPCENTGSTEETSELAVKTDKVAGVDLNDQPTIRTQVMEHSPEQEDMDVPTKAPSETVQCDTSTTGSGSIGDAIVMPTPSTPPFPTSTDEDSEDELENIEFASRDPNLPDGTAIKTPRKPGVLDINGGPERNPLGEVVLNG